MIIKFEIYENKTKIPEYLQALPRIPFEVYRKYRWDYYNPSPLLELCCQAIDSPEFQLWLDKSTKPKWTDMEKTLQCTRNIVTNSCARLCTITNPKEASIYLKTRAKGTSILELLKITRIVMEETTHERRLSELQNHWARIPLPAKYPCVLIGRRSKQEVQRKRVWRRTEENK